VRFLRGFARFWYDFIIGDDWKIAAVVVAVLLLGVALVSTGVLAGAAVTLLLGALMLLGYAVVVIVELRAGS
jgi:hypothetical protein